MRQANKQGINQNRFHELYNTWALLLKPWKFARGSLRKAISLSSNFHVPHINLGTIARASERPMRSASGKR